MQKMNRHVQTKNKRQAPKNNEIAYLPQVHIFSSSRAFFYVLNVIVLNWHFFSCPDSQQFGL